MMGNQWAYILRISLVVLVFLVGETASALDIGPEERVPVPAEQILSETDAAKLRELVEACARTGDEQHLVAATQLANVDRISEEFKVVERTIVPFFEQKDAVHSEPLPHSRPCAVLDSPETDTFHVVCVRTMRIPPANHYGDPTHLISRLFYLQKHRGKWSEPVVVMDYLLCVSDVRIVAGVGQEVILLVQGHNDSAEANSMGVKPGDVDRLVISREANGKWAVPEQIAEDDPRWKSPHPSLPGVSLTCALASKEGEPGRYVVSRPGRDGKPDELLGEIRLPDSGNDLRFNYGGWSLPIAMQGPDGKPYAIMSENANLYLMRMGDEGTEAICLGWESGGGYRRANFLWYKDRLVHLLWTHQGKSLSFYTRFRIPEEGWEPVEQVVWKTRAGCGLAKMDKRYLLSRAIAAARTLEQKSDIEGAIQWYINIVVCFKSEQREAAIKRLVELHRAGRTEVMLQVLAYAEKNPDAAKGWPLRNLMVELGLADRKHIR